MSDPSAKGEIREKKVKLSVWWGVHGIYCFKLLPDKTTVTVEVYCAQLQRLADKIRKEHLKTSQKIEELGLEVLPHPPYSPDLASERLPPLSIALTSPGREALR
ncbi:hypothetical protein RB195_024320 [Necator americanus]|uniref:Mariner Mos1 transposase n=1 Tax=Necator americanus TaxID=51031 RepID=A0ABR1ENI1_NECAM